MKPHILTSETEIPREGFRTIDALSGALKELFLVKNPQWKKGMPGMEEARDTFLKNCAIAPVWIVYEEQKVIVKTVPEEIYFELRTSRNRNIITREEQKKYRETVVGIAGLSVGSAIVEALVMSGGPKQLKIADFDELEVTNLNRIRGTLLEIGKNKTDIAAERVWAIDPFAEITLFDKGVNKENLENFIAGNPKLQIFIDEMDSIDCKILSRLIARREKIPVLMATDNGNSVILDVERFDLEPERKLFHGNIPEMDMEEVKNLDFHSWLKLATQIVSPDYLTERMQDSLLGIGKTIPAVPQLGTTASIAGAAMAYAVRAIAPAVAGSSTAGTNLPSGRYVIGLEEKLIPEYLSKENEERRKTKTQDFLSRFGKK